MCSIQFHFRRLSLFCSALLLFGCSSWQSIAAKREAHRSAAGLAEVGLVLESQGRTPQAIECFEKALEQEPSNKMLQEKIVALKSQRKTGDKDKAVVKVDDVFRRYGAGEVPQPEKSPLVSRFKSVAYSADKTADEENADVGAQTPLREL